MALATSIQAWWKMDEASNTTRVDSYGSNNLTDVNSNVSQVAGKISNAASFNGTTAYLRADDAAALSTGDIDFFASLWFKLNSTASHQSIFKKDGEYGIRYISGAGLRFYFGSVVVVSSVTLSSGTWYHVVIYHDSSADLIGMYQRHASASPETASDSGHGVVDGNGALNFGRDPNDSEYMNGVIDLAGCWKRVPVLQDVDGLYASGAGIDYPFTVAYAISAPIHAGVGLTANDFGPLRSFIY